MNTQELCRLPIALSRFSPDFCLRCEQMGLSSMGDILAADPRQLTRHPAFTHLWLAELTDFLESRQALHLLQPGPGSNSG